MKISKQKRILRLLIGIPAAFLLLLVAYLGLVLLRYIQPNPWLKEPDIQSDPDVQLARRSCRNISGDKFDCCVQYAIEYENPNICALTSIFVDDVCLDEVWRAVGDPSICERIYLESVRPNCRAYFRDHPAVEGPNPK